MPKNYLSDRKLSIYVDTIMSFAIKISKKSSYISRQERIDRLRALQKIYEGLHLLMESKYGKSQ